MWPRMHVMKLPNLQFSPVTCLVLGQNILRFYPSTLQNKSYVRT